MDVRSDRGNLRDKLRLNEPVGYRHKVTASRQINHYLVQQSPPIPIPISHISTPKTRADARLLLSSIITKTIPANITNNLSAPLLPLLEARLPHFDLQSDMGHTYRTYLAGESVYVCRACHNHLAVGESVLSKVSTPITSITGSPAWLSLVESWEEGI